MAVQSITIGTPTNLGNNVVSWGIVTSVSPLVELVNPKLRATPGTAAYIRYFQIQNISNTCQMYLTEAQSGEAPSDPGPDLTAAWESAAKAITVRAGDISLVLEGPNNVAAEVQDPAEIYTWRLPSRISDISTFITAYNGLTANQRAATTLELFDDDIGFYWGAQDVTKAYWGATEVTRAYYGSARIF